MHTYIHIYICIYVKGGRNAAFEIALVLKDRDTRRRLTGRNRNWNQDFTHTFLFRSSSYDGSDMSSEHINMLCAVMLLLGCFCVWSSSFSFFCLNGSFVCLFDWLIHSFIHSFIAFFFFCMYVYESDFVCLFVCLCFPSLF